MEARLLSPDQIDAPAWDAFIRSSPQGSIFAHAGFMDAVCPGWQAIEVVQDGQRVALMPLNIKRKAGMLYSLQPPFAQHWGIFLAPQAHGNPYREYSWKRKAILACLDALPAKLRLFAHTFSPAFDYATPLHWQGFSLSTRYTYQLPADADPDTLLQRLDKDKRAEIRSAEKAGLSAHITSDTSLLLRLAQVNEASGKPVTGHGGTAMLDRLATHLLQSGQGTLLEARHEGRAIAAVLLAHDTRRSYYLAGVQDPEHRKLPAINMLLWEGITRFAGPGRVFDFEGSMIEPVEAFFRGFGAKPVPYLFIQKNRLPLLVRWIRKSR